MGAAEKQLGDDDVWLSTKDAAKFLGISSNAIRHHVCRGNLRPDSRAGEGHMRGHRFSLATLKRFRAGGEANDNG